MRQHSHACTHACMNARTHTHTRTHARTLSHSHMYNFKCVVETIPDGADVVFMFGEIDCRDVFFNIIFIIFIFLFL